MPIGLMDAPQYKVPEYASPLLEGLTTAMNVTNQGADTYKTILANQMAAPKAALAPQFAQAELQQAQALPGKTRAETQEDLALAGMYGQDAQKQAILNRFLPQRETAEIGEIGSRSNLARAQAQEAQFYAQHPLLKLSGPAGQIGALQYLQANPGQPNTQGGAPSQPSQDFAGNGLNVVSQGSPNQPETVIPNMPQAQQQPQAGGQANIPTSYEDILRKSLFSSQQKNISMADYQQKRANAFAYSTAPIDAKNFMLAQLAGAGYDPDQAVNRLAQGATMDDLLREKGFDPQNRPEPDYFATKGNIQQLKNRQAALKEMDNLSAFVQEGLGPYSRTIMGMSIPQIKDAISGMNQDQQAKFLAARAITPEMGGLRLMTANAKSTVYAQKALMNKSMLNIGAFRALVNGDVWLKSQKLIDQKLGEAMGKSIEAYSPKAGGKVFTQKSGGRVRHYNMQTGAFE